MGPGTRTGIGQAHSRDRELGGQRENIDRAELSGDDYENGDTSELAGRGLYGSYALFFPAGVLSQDGGFGLNLNAVEDILLRLDYVSVAR